MKCLVFKEYSKINYISSGNFLSAQSWIHPKREITSFEIIIINSGSFDLFANDHQYTLNPDDMVLIFPSKLHYGTKSISEKLSFYWFHFEFESENDYKIEENPLSQDNINNIIVPEYLKFSQSDKIAILFKQLLHYSNNKNFNKFSSDLIANLLLNEISIQYKSAILSPILKKSKSKTNEILDWVRANVYRGITIKEIAERFEINEDYLNRLVKKQTGMNIKQYIISTQLSKAKELLLNTKDPIKSVSSQTGFFDEKNFMKIFKKYEGITPSEYRNAYYFTHLNSR